MKVNKVNESKIGVFGIFRVELSVNEMVALKRKCCERFNLEKNKIYLPSESEMAEIISDCLIDGLEI